MGATLAELTWVTVTIRLPRPLRAGALVIGTRQYCCVRVVLGGDHDGAIGEAFVLTRGLDVEAALRDLIAPRLLGGPVGPDTEAELRVGLRNAGWDGPISRAAAAVFLAVLDARARAAELPVWRLLTSAPADPPRVVTPIGYTPVGAGPGAETGTDTGEAELDEARRAIDAGAAVVKLMGGFDAPEVDLARLRRLRAAVGGRGAIALDVNGAWSRDEAIALFAQLAELEVAFVEDPWAIELGLAGSWPEPQDRPAIAIGEACASGVELESLAATGRVRHVRPDVTVLGGPERFLAPLPEIARSGAELMPHFWPEVHRHFVLAYPGPSWVEATLPGAGGFGIETFVHGGVHVGPGLTHPPSAPGFGYALDWDALRAHADAPPTTSSTATFTT